MVSAFQPDSLPRLSCLPDGYPGDEKDLPHQKKSILDFFANPIFKYLILLIFEAPSTVICIHDNHITTIVMA
ncbi:MAG TPA: hypothetical protein VN372_14675 [Methanospirillum sp.]|nr:hypothetical protein [Methanospirillum sp.]